MSSAPGFQIRGPSGFKGPSRYVALLVAAFAFSSGPLAAANADAAKTRELVSVLQSSTDLFARARACQQLAIIGTADAIPALAALLADEKLGGYARDALEVMPDERALAALRDSLGRLNGDRLIGVINSLGVRRDAAAVSALGRLAAYPSPEVAAAAFLALGRIATPDAARVVEMALARGPEPIRTAAAEACLLSADQYRADGRNRAAIALYDAVRQAAVTGQLRITAAHGAIVSRGEAGLPLLLEHLHSSDVALRDVALRSARELAGPAVTSALIAELARARPVVQALIIDVLVDRGDPGALAAIESRAAAPDAEVRIAALTGLGRIGGPSSVPVLLRAVTSAPAGAELNAATSGLARIKAPEVPGAILAAMPPASPTVRARLITVLGERNAESATRELLQWAQDADPEVSRAALRALSLVTRPADLPALITLAVAVKDDERRTLADRAIVTTSMKVLEPARRADAVLAAFRAADPTTQAALLRPLGAVVRTMGGSYDAFIAVRAALKADSPPLRQAALEVLAGWPDATPATTLLDFVRRNPNTPQRDVAFQGAMRMAGNVAAGRDRSPLNPMTFLSEANALVRSREDKMAVVSALGDVRQPGAFALLQPYLDDSAVQPEAALALVQIAPALLNSSQSTAVKVALAKMANSSRDEDTRRKAARLAKGLPTPVPKKKAGGGGAAVAAGNRATPALPPGVLFNGSDLSGWEGEPAVWRVRDGVIVGGSLEGNPRNEFLATKRSYRNFVLRLDYRLAGTEGFVNGGVQFRSVRVKQPANEMSGYQADIGAGHSGKLYDESRRKKFLAETDAEQIRRLEKPGDWNHYEVTCRGPHIEIALNGERTIAYDEPDRTIKQDGLVALQIHGNCKAEIMFRQIVIEELP